MRSTRAITMKRVAATQRAAREGLQRRRSTVAAKDRGSSSKAHRPHAGGTRRERESRRAAKRADSLPRLGALLDAQREPMDGYPLRNSGTPRALPAAKLAKLRSLARWTWVAMDAAGSMGAVLKTMSAAAAAIRAIGGAKVAATAAANIVAGRMAKKAAKAAWNATNNAARAVQGAAATRAWEKAIADMEEAEAERERILLILERVALAPKAAKAANKIEWKWDGFKNVEARSFKRGAANWTRRTTEGRKGATRALVAWWQQQNQKITWQRPLGRTT